MDGHHLNEHEKNKNSPDVSFASFDGEVTYPSLFRWRRVVERDPVGTLGDQTKQFIEFAFLYMSNFLARLTFHLDLTFHKNAFEKKLVARRAAILLKGNTHTREKHNLLWLPAQYTTRCRVKESGCGYQIFS